MKRLCLALCMLLLCAASAQAADPGAIMGRWNEKMANGNTIVTVFAPTIITTYTVDKNGKVIAAPRKTAVAYRNLDPVTIGIDFQNGGGMTAHVNDPRTIVLDSPAIGAHRLHRAP